MQAPIGKSKPVYLLSNASPINIPDQTQYIFFSKKTALYRAINESAQNKINGVSGDETNESTDTIAVEKKSRKAFCTFSLLRKRTDNL